jgi:hypothetical protein
MVLITMIMKQHIIVKEILNIHNSGVLNTS